MQKKEPGQVIDAFNYFLQAFPNNPQAPSALAQRAIAYKENKDYSRARADLDAHRPREAALQARIALEAVLAELPADTDPELAAARAEVGDAANAALTGDPPGHLQHAVAHAVERMERALRRRPGPPEPPA